MRSTRRLGAAGAVALSLVLAGCTGDGDPDPTSSTKSPGTATSTGTATPTETVALPVLPDEAKVESDAGAVAFVKHWFALVNYGYRTGDTMPLREMSPPECEGCFQYIDLIEDLTTDGSRAVADPVEIQTINSPPPVAGAVVVSVTYTQPAVAITGGTGPGAQVTQADEQLLQTALEWGDDGWSVLGFGT